MNKPMTNALRAELKMQIKNGNDISDLIEGIDIKGENLSGAIIKKFNRIHDNISGTRFSKATIGTLGTVTNLSGTIMRNCQFDDVQFLGTVFMRRCDCRDSIFSGALMYNLEYQKTDFRGCKFCETAIRLGSNYSMGSKFSPDVFQDLANMWGLDVKVKETE